MPKPKLLTSAEVSERLGIRPQTLGYHVRLGRITPAHQNGPNAPKLFSAGEVRRFEAKLKHLRKGTNRWENKVEAGL